MVVVRRKGSIHTITKTMINGSISSCSDSSSGASDNDNDSRLGRMIRGATPS